MPELPEVETVVRTLEKQLKGQTIEDVRVIYGRIVDNCSPDVFSVRLKEQRFEEFDRRGKFLIFRLSDKTLVAHLRMEGKFFYYEKETEVSKHTHVVFKLSKGYLHYNDVRKFGRFYLYEKGEQLKAIEKLGKEPFDPELSSEYLREYCRKLSQPIKSVLLDQSMIAGIGNIYADEICAMVGMDPCHPSSLISLNDWERIIEATRAVLADAIKAGGTTIRSYTSSLGITGRFQQKLLVHSQQKCTVCGGEVIKIRLGGRGTYFCPKCQKTRLIRIAISGLIGAGKTTFSDLLRKRGLPVASCDQINAQILQEQETIERLSEIFNCDKGKIDKQYISERIFSDDVIKGRVESLLHALIYQEIEKFYLQHDEEEMVFVEVPLLFETDWYRRFDCNVLVVAGEKTVRERLKNNRGYSDEKTETILSKQKNNEEKIAMSDYVINNDSDISALEKKADRFLKDIKAQIERNH